MRCPTCSSTRSTARARMMRPLRFRPREAIARRTPEVEAAYAIAHARLTIAMGIALHCATRSVAWGAVSLALCELTRALGWRVRATSLSVSQEAAAPHVQRALDAIEQLVALRANEPSLMSRVDGARTAITGARDALSRTNERLAG